MILNIGISNYKSMFLILLFSNILPNYLVLKGFESRIKFTMRLMYFPF